MLTAEQYVQSLIAWNASSESLGSDAASETRCVAVIGAGLMGTAIAAANVQTGIPVILVDVCDELLATAKRRVAAEIAFNEQILPQTAVDRLLQPTADESRVAECDLVIESIPENPALKQPLYARLEPRLSAGAILVSNTSTIPIGKLAAGLADPSRFCGLHFFHPVRRRPLVEVIRGAKTAAETVASAARYARQIGKMPIVVDDGPGFLVNRLLMPYLNSALELLLDGVSIEAVERAATNFGMAMGPLRLIDEIGLETAMLAGKVLWQAFPDRVAPSPLLVAMYKAKRMGRKAKTGFFAYPEGLSLDQPGLADPSVQPVIDAWRRGSLDLPDEAIVRRLLDPMVLEARRILDEQTVSDPRAIDLATLFGLGFPRSRGGLLYWAESAGPFSTNV